jgi:hypothetical protein
MKKYLFALLAWAFLASGVVITSLDAAPPVQQEDVRRGDQRLHRLRVCGVIGEGLPDVQESVCDGGHDGM